MSDFDFSSDSPDPAGEIFLNALEMDKDGERKAYLDHACGADAELRAVVDALLKDHEGATEFFFNAERELPLPDEVPCGTDVGTSIGPYRVVGVLGEGGCGTVYEAEQDTPIHRRVALKILRSGMDTDRIISLFEAERQTLALMEHPNIARVLDAGATTDGRPYFAMELVHGSRITSYCECNASGIEERLRLMREVCAAVQHAHNKGVIHRDIKPSNILVTQVDGVAVPKVIDFGIARATTVPAEAKSGGFSQNQWVGTPAYMSPEQFDTSTGDIDTRSDVYSLGVVLYELIAGKTPFGGEISRNSYDEIHRRVRDELPKTPSEHFSNGRIHRSKELDCIILKAIEKNRERRYPTVQALATDIDCFLRNEPVLAHPPSHWYRMRKLVMRNRVASATLAASLLALVGGCTISTLLYLRTRTAEHEQARLRADSEEREHVTKAAILLMQGKTAKADAEIRRMGGILTQPSLEATNVFHDLATWSAMNGDWKTSADRWLALSRVNRFDDSDMTDNATRDLLPIAPTLIICGDFERYHELQHMIVSRLGRTNNPIAAEHLLKLCLQIPASQEMLDTLTPAMEVAKRSLDGTEGVPANRLEAWRCTVIGLWYYRSGRYTDAIKWCDRALLLYDRETTRDVQTLLIRAMARRFGNNDAAAENDLNEARAIIARRFSQPLDFNTGGFWHDWLDARILLGEAEEIFATEPPPTTDQASKTPQMPAVDSASTEH